MADGKKYNLFILGIVAVFAYFAFSQPQFQGAIFGTETMTRTIPEEVQPGATFQIEYGVFGVSDNWGASVIDTATGGCKFFSGTGEFKTVLLSTKTRSITVTAPESGSCTFSGNYKFGSFETINFPQAQINIVEDAVCSPIYECGAWSSWSNGNCGTRTRACTDAICSLPSKAESESKSCVSPKQTSIPPEGTLSEERGEIDCEFWEKEKEGSCEFNSGIAVLAGLGIFMIMLFKR